MQAQFDGIITNIDPGSQRRIASTLRIPAGFQSTGRDFFVPCGKKYLRQTLQNRRGRCMRLPAFAKSGAFAEKNSKGFLKTFDMVLDT